MDALNDMFRHFRANVNDQLEPYDGFTITVGAIGTYILATLVYHILFVQEDLFGTFKRKFFGLARKIPFVQGKIDEQVEDFVKGMKKEFLQHHSGVSTIALPEKGRSASEIRDQLEQFEGIGSMKERHEAGKVSGTIYVGGKDFEAYNALLTETYGKFAWTNPLHPEVFPAVRQMESEVVAMCCNLFHGGPDSCGSITSGGTESIIMAIKAYRDFAKRKRGVTRPNLVMSRTAHPAFDKGCDYLGVALRKVQEDEDTRAVDPKKMARYIDSNTIAIVGSCPQYPHGSVDPIPELAQLAKDSGVGLHVDCCLGSFVVPFIRKAGYDFIDFDFALDGVTSISCDTHKYGCAPKGSSVVMYSNKELHQHQYSVFTDWPGGIYGTPSLAGSRPGALVAATWVSLVANGYDGYLENAKTILGVTRKIAAGIKSIEGLKLVVEPEASVVTWTSDVFDINRLKEPLTKEYGWDINVLQFPPAIHLCVTNAHSTPGCAEKFIEDLATISAKLVATKHEKATGDGAVYGTSQSIPDRSIIADIVNGFLDSTYVTV